MENACVDYVLVCSTLMAAFILSSALAAAFAGAAFVLLSFCVAFVPRLLLM